MTMAEKVEKERLDVLLVQQGLASSRELAKAYIMAGNVMLILPVLILYLFFSKYIVSSFTYSGIK